MTVFVQLANHSASGLRQQLEAQFGQRFSQKLMIPVNRTSDVHVDYLGIRTFATPEEIGQQIHQTYLKLLSSGYWGTEDIIPMENTLSMREHIESLSSFHHFQVINQKQWKFHTCLSVQKGRNT